MDFIVLYYSAAYSPEITDVQLVKAKDIETAFEETENPFACNIVIPKNKKNKAKIVKMLKMF